MASLSSCFALSFRAIAKANKLDWSGLTLNARGELDKVDRVTRFTMVTIDAQLLINSSDDLALAEKLLAKAEASCLITNSLSCEIDLISRVAVA